ncbi:ATPase synthesis protein 25 [Penicillium argentinense]|uniref:ATPase synthesis protein 25 n=1 Tax=Penicillium argentinense TaxID=1131581 RepID=A0A9W9FDB6_9EURO|nr:ATPase synthesis protein 25 [Penicillium argentinense]KAJ5098082.1 ATPase synthesis protein 25 [Penicillium argentinense]
MSRALLRGAACNSCRHEVVRSFLAASGVPMPRYTFAIRPAFTSRAFSAVGTLRSDRPPVSQPPEINPSPVEGNAVESTPRSSAATPHVPWYLQEEAPVDESRAVPSDHIPQIPENSPEMLPVLLEYTYKDLGLDELKLFDLRGLDIPAALGANTIMIIGTARSVKHLNVSADRLCRWLRSKYKLSPYADGLLGRNELKIKLRRKAKRARAAANAGRMVDEKDDGITTGWICVNAGTVDKGATVTELSDAGFEGFGQLDTGTNVVVQIFTEEKRSEVDLDGLWQGTLDRAERKRQQDLQDSTESTPIKGRAPKIAGYPGGQTRGIHTVRDGPSKSADSNMTAVFSTPSALGQVPGSGMSTEVLLEILTGLPHESARSELGTGPDDYQSTLFLRLLHGSLPSDMSHKDIASLRLKLQSIGISRQHPAYSKQGLFTSFTDYLGNTYDLKDDLAFEVVSALLTPQKMEGQFGQPVSILSEADIELALQVLERLSLRGVPILNLKVFNMLYQVAGTTADLPSNQDHPLEWTESQRQMLSRLSKIVAAADVPFDVEQARQLMVTQFQCEDYDGFWRLWRQFPLKGVSRTPEDYRRLFQLHADLGEEKRARDCISAWVPMMEREAIPVLLQGSVVTPLMHCLLVADADIQNRAQEGTASYFLDVWTQCQEALVQGPG